MFGFGGPCSYFSLLKLRYKLRDIISALKDCYNELNDGSMNIGLCLEEVLAEEEPSACNGPKYDTCRKVYVCAAKKLGLLDETGRVIPPVLKQYKTRVDDDEEFDKVYKACKSVKGTHSDAVINTLRCILRTSTKARKKMDEIVPILEKHF